MAWSVIVFCVPSTLCCGLVGVLCPFYTVLWVGLCYVSLLHCVVGWFVIVFCVPSKLCCGLVCNCVMCPFYTALFKKRQGFCTPGREIVTCMRWSVGGVGGA